MMQHNTVYRSTLRYLVRGWFDVRFRNTILEVRKTSRNYTRIHIVVVIRRLWYLLNKQFKTGERYLFFFIVGITIWCKNDLGPDGRASRLRRTQTRFSVTNRFTVCRDSRKKKIESNISRVVILKRKKTAIWTRFENRIKNLNRGCSTDLILTVVWSRGLFATETRFFSLGTYNAVQHTFVLN